MQADRASVPVQRHRQRRAGCRARRRIKVPSVASSSVAGKTPRDVLGDRALPSGSSLPRSPWEHLANIDGKLMPQRLIEPHLGDARVLVDVGPGIVADDGEHRINRDDACDQERDQQQPKDRDGDRRQLAAEDGGPSGKQARRVGWRGNGGCGRGRASPCGGPRLSCSNAPDPAPRCRGQSSATDGAGVCSPSGSQFFTIGA